MTNDVKITLRFYPGQDDDLIVWLDNLQAPYGKKGETLKETLRRGLSRPVASGAVSLETGSLLADIRQVVEAAIQTSLAALALQPSAEHQKVDKSDQTEERLSRLDQNLAIGGDGFTPWITNEQTSF